MMQRFLITICGGLMLALPVTTPAHAIERLQAGSYSCSQLQSAVRQQGAVVIRYPSSRTPGLTLYDRYVASQRYCARGEVLEKASVPARDTASCRLSFCETRRDDLLCDDDSGFKGPFCN